MDIIYLLRYLNQTNNFVNYNDMGFELKKLIVGCLKLAIIKENRINKKICFELGTNYWIEESRN